MFNLKEIKLLLIEYIIESKILKKRFAQLVLLTYINMHRQTRRKERGTTLPPPL